MDKKFDFKKEFKALYKASTQKAELVDVPPFKFLKLKGMGDPANSKEFQEKVQALYGLAFTIKFILKKNLADPFDYAVAPLSALWYADDITAFVKNRRKEWKWTLMIKQPDRVSPDRVEEAQAKLAQKKEELKHLNEIHLEIYEEGLSAQIMHLGPYSEEAPTIQKLHDYMSDRGYTFNGAHHEIYLGDPRRSRPDTLKTIIRQPVTKR